MEYNSVLLDFQQRERQAQQRDLEARQKACEADWRSVEEFFVDETTLNIHQLFIVRDDKLCGGTKSRIVEAYMREHESFDEFVYPTTWFGGAQLALAWGAKQVGKKAVLFTPPLTYFRPAFIEMSERLGAEYHFAEDYYAEMQAYVAKNPSKRKAVENGLGSAKNIKRLVNIATRLRDVYGRFDELWVAVGSGTLLSSLQIANLADEYYGVCVFNRCPITFRNAKARYPPESFDEPALQPPWFPSASHYDAKVMDMLEKKIRDRPKRILFWNVM